jgi:hypothetical protein
MELRTHTRMSVSTPQFLLCFRKQLLVFRRMIALSTAITLWWLRLAVKQVS